MQFERCIVQTRRLAFGTFCYFCTQKFRILNLLFLFYSHQEQREILKPGKGGILRNIFFYYVANYLRLQILLIAVY